MRATDTTSCYVKLRANAPFSICRFPHDKVSPGISENLAFGAFAPLPRSRFCSLFWAARCNLNFVRRGKAGDEIGVFEDFAKAVNIFVQADPQTSTSSGGMDFWKPIIGRCLQISIGERGIKFNPGRSDGCFIRAHMYFFGGIGLRLNGKPCG